MKRKKLLLAATIILGTKALAMGGDVVLTSSDYASYGNPVQQAVVSPSSMFYNPSALGFLEEGKYFTGGLAAVIPKYEIDDTKGGHTTSLKIDTLQAAPTFGIVKVTPNYSYYMGSALTGQGGILNFASGNEVLESQKDILLPLGLMTGVTKKLNSQWSVSAGIRATYYFETLEGKVTNLSTGGTTDAKYKVTGGGVAPEVGIFYRPTEKLDFGVKYLARTKLIKNGQTEEGGDVAANKVALYHTTTTRKDIPAVLETGAGYKLTPKDSVYAGYNLLFERAVKYTEQYYNSISNGQEYMAGYTRQINEKWAANLGYTYSAKGKSDNYPETIFELDAQTVGLSADYKYSETIKLTAAASVVYYDHPTSTNEDGDTLTPFRREIFLGFGITKKF